MYSAQSKAKQSKAKQSKAKQSKAKQSKAKQSKAKNSLDIPRNVNFLDGRGPLLGHPRSTGGPRARRNGRRVCPAEAEFGSKMSIFEEGVVSILRMIGTECRAGAGRVLHHRDDAGRNPKSNAARTSGKRSRECIFRSGACRCCGTAWS
jgi:hypothetical protein